MGVSMVSALVFAFLTSFQTDTVRMRNMYLKSSIYHKRNEIKTNHQAHTLIRIFIIQYFCAYIFVSFFTICFRFLVYTIFCP